MTWSTRRKFAEKIKKDMFVKRPPRRRGGAGGAAKGRPAKDPTLSPPPPPSQTLPDPPHPHKPPLSTLPNPPPNSHASGGAAGAFTCNTGTTAFINFVKSYYTSYMLGVDFDIEASQTATDIANLVKGAQAAQAVYPTMRFSFTIATLGAKTNASNLNAQGDSVRGKEGLAARGAGAPWSPCRHSLGWLCTSLHAPRDHPAAARLVGSAPRPRIHSKPSIAGHESNQSRQLFERDHQLDGDVFHSFTLSFNPSFNPL